MKIGAAKAEAGLCWGAVAITLPEAPAKAQTTEPVTFSVPPQTPPKITAATTPAATM